MIDYDYEDRLIERIAVREAARRLSPRQRHILCRYYRHGETYREVGTRVGLSGMRVSQILDRTVVQLRRDFREPAALSATRPGQTTRDTPPPGFDKAAFLRHMQLLIHLREQRVIWERQEQARREREAAEQEIAREQREFEKERAALAGLIASEKAQSEPKPKVTKPSQYIYEPPPYHFVINSPSYAPPPLPTQDELSNMAMRALEYLLQARPQHFPGTPWLGQWATSVVFTRDGGSVGEAVNSILRELPSHARLSAFPVPVEKNVLGANFTTPCASLRVTVTPDGLKLRFDVTWD